MRVLVGCECSQTVAGAFLRAGHDAYSCDISPAYGSYPDRHLQGDLRDIYAKVNPDLFIAHPPCTYLSRAGLGRLVPGGCLDWLRYERGLLARDFFLWCLSRPAPMICVENPVPIARFGLPPATQYIEPYYFGEPFSKKTGLWLVGLPELRPSEVVVPGASWTAVHFSQRIRSKTFDGVAAAMVDQWGGSVPVQLRFDWR